MRLSKVKLGNLIELVEEKNKDLLYGEQSVRGVNNQKQFITTKANLATRDLSKFQIVRPGYFVFNHRTSRNGSKFSISLNSTNETYICTEDYVIFKVKKDCKHLILEMYLYMYFNRNEFDRYVITNSWGSSTEFFNWQDICDVEMEIPSLDIQRKYVEIYEGLLQNLNSYVNRINDLKLTCDIQIQEVYKNVKRYKMESFAIRRTEKNSDFSVKKLIGVGKDGFIEPKQSKDETNGHICYLVKKYDFVYAPPQIHSGSIDYYTADEVVKCSDAYAVFYLINDMLNPYYLFAILKSPFFQKYAYFYRDGVREQFDFEQLKEYEIPVPDKETQSAIAELFKSLSTYSKFISELKQKISNICPILIRGAVKEAKGGN